MPRPSSDATVWDRRIRRTTYGVIGVVVVLGILGLLGVRTTTSLVSSNGYTIEVTHASVTRGGLATPFSIDVTRTDGGPLPPVVTLGVSSSYLRIFDDNGMEPLPTASFATPETTWWEFEVPSGADHLLVELDARLEPAVQWGARGTVELRAGDQTIATTSFLTLVMP